MCRMFGIVGDFQEAFPDLFNALQDVARHDPLLELSGNEPPRHSDGWGYVSSSSGSLVHFRTANPIYNSGPIDPENGFFIAHARKASPSEPLGATNSHPYHASDETMEVYLAHNGAFEKRGLADIIGIKETEDQTDSEFFLQLMMLQKGTLMQRLGGALGIIRQHRLLAGTPNLIVLGIRKDNGMPELLYYTAAPNSGVYTEYNRLYLVRGNGWTGVFSSSITGSEFFPEDTEKEVVRTGVILSLDTRMATESK
ncbi:MAG: hypothetical protein B2I17_09305 [Thermoplasmatales archaeon B_DKE]|nr:MAG: hypothetical protein B2I17_09305 [Thermoplasmatales archaeon B_DKE]